ncbi:MAG TPA: hypothetical protein VFF06_13190 [Polyangia bacterium]|nr:hypothetical protein [Polyangia bacterium]
MRSSILAVCLLGACSGNGLNSQNGDAGSSTDLAMSSSSDLAAPSGDLAGAMCDLLKQDCPSGNKCVAVNMMMMTSFQCVPLAGMVTDGQPCMRGMNGMPDDCNAGLTCTTRGSTTMNPLCRKLCGADSDCDAGQKCTVLSNRTPTVGVCIPSCTPFGTDCSGGLTCATTAVEIGSTMQNPKIVFTCRGVGTTPAFGQCMRSTDCVADTACDQGGTCEPLCDDSHQCPTNPNADAGALSCMPIGSTLASNPGVCG